ncbi:uncharacterized protein LOC107402019 [Peromyscus maniculatus bairdii]|uniref:uncharacterized protein LOC107402019 n=1 Tax=Peromyscus maniculatus bairdii TaxID=230844 RepID=UPI003FD668E4
MEDGEVEEGRVLQKKTLKNISSESIEIHYFPQHTRVWVSISLGRIHYGEILQSPLGQITDEFMNLFFSVTVNREPLKWISEEKRMAIGENHLRCPLAEDSQSHAWKYQHMLGRYSQPRRKI